MEKFGISNKFPYHLPFGRYYKEVINIVYDHGVVEIVSIVLCAKFQKRTCNGIGGTPEEVV